MSRERLKSYNVRWICAGSYAPERSEVASESTPGQAGSFRPTDVAMVEDGRAHGRMASLPRPKRRRAAAVQDAGARRHKPGEGGASGSAVAATK